MRKDNPDLGVNLVAGWDHDLERINELSTSIGDYVKMMEAKFITGEEPIENFDNYVKELKNLGIEEYIGIYQNAYDDYFKNLQAIQ